jgi:recombination DNA repair RAD52 pathway protein
MSNKTKSSPVVVITVSTEQFNEALAGIATNGASIKAQFVIAGKFIAQATNKTDQDKSKKALAKAYQALQTTLNGKEFAFDSATKWVQRNVKTLSGNPKFKWLVSKTAAAAKKRAARAGGKTPAAPAPAAAPAEKPTSIEQFRNAIIAKEVQIQDEFRNFIPSGKIREYDQAFAAFIQTLNVILK